MGKDTKFCRNCGKELPIESTFCPYCMTKLIDVTTGGEIKVKKKKPIIIAVSAAIVLLIVIAVIIILNSTIFGGKSDNITTHATTVPTTAVTTTAENKTLDYSKYVGIWCDKDSDISTATQNGGNILEIISVKDDVVRFTFTKTSSAPQNRIARISNVTTKVIDGIGTFSFDDDGWQNSGTGKIKFSDGEIYIENTITNQNSGSMWDIGGKFYLKIIHITVGTDIAAVCRTGNSCICHIVGIVTLMLPGTALLKFGFDDIISAIIRILSFYLYIIFSCSQSQFNGIR